ncbi:MAG TPA: hypothetical protein VK187_12300 [Geobacteraceae bacterium]|nr:hypothetical protein [Geobacteraceae bacterium]
MAILVHFKGNKFDYVEDSDLETLIANKAIFAFKHESGWIKIDQYPISRTGVLQHDFEGQERESNID